MPSDKRRVEKVYRIDSSSDDDAVRLQFHGHTGGRNPIRVTVELPWYMWPHLVENVRQRWRHVRANRISAIGRIDQSFTTPPTQP